MSMDSNQGAQDQSGYFTWPNISSFLNMWGGGGASSGDSPLATPPATAEQVEQAEAAREVASSWNVNYSATNIMQALSYPLAGLAPAFDIYGFAEDDEDLGKASASLDGFSLKTKTGAEIEIEGAEADGLDLQLVSNLIWGTGVMEIGRLHVKSLSYKSEIIEISASITLTDVWVQMTKEVLLKSVGLAFHTIMFSAETELEVEGQDTSYAALAKTKLKELGSTLGGRIVEHLRTDGVSIGTVKVDNLKVVKFGPELNPEVPGITAAQATAGAVVAKFLEHADLSVDEARIHVELEGDLPVGGTGEIVARDTHIKVGSNEDGVTIEGGTTVDLNGTAKAKIGDLNATVVVKKASAFLVIESGLLTVNDIEITVNVKGKYADENTALTMQIDLSGVVLSASIDRGSFVNCIANEVLSGVQAIFIWVIGDGHPTGYSPEQLRATFIKMAAVNVRDVLLKQMKITLGAKVGHFGAKVLAFQYGEYAGSAELTVDDVDLSAVLDPENPIEMKLTADVLMNAMLYKQNENVLEVKAIKVDLDDSGNGSVTGKLALHSSGLTEVLGRVLGTASKSISKEVKLNVKIANYAVDLNTTLVVMSNPVLDGLVRFVLKHVCVSRGDNPGLGVTAKFLKKRATKKLVPPEAFGQREQGDTDEIMVPIDEARRLFNDPKSTGAVNLLAFLQSNIQTRLDNLAAWEPDDPLADPASKPQPAPALTVETVPLITKKQEKAARKLDAARREYAAAIKAANGDQSEEKVTKAQSALDKAKKGLLDENQKVIDKEKSKLDSALKEIAKQAVAAVKSARKGSKKNATKEERYAAEVTAAQQLLVNNCLIDAIAGGAGRGTPTLPELVAIRTELNNVGEMMLATPKTVSAIRKGLGLPGRKVIVRYPAPIPQEVFDGTDPPILVDHTGQAHFVAA